MKTTEEVKTRIKELESQLQRLDGDISKFGYFNVSEDTKRYQEEKSVQLRTLYWVIGYQ
jgi:hypothetical protein